MSGRLRKLHQDSSGRRPGRRPASDYKLSPDGPGRLRTTPAPGFRGSPGHRPGSVEHQQLAENIVVRDVHRPTVRGGHSRIKGISAERSSCTSSSTASVLTPADRAVDVAHRMREALRVAQSVDVERRSRERAGRCRSRGSPRGSQRRAARSARCALRRSDINSRRGHCRRWRPEPPSRCSTTATHGLSGRGTTLGLQSDRRRAVIVPRRRCPNAETRGGVDRTARRRPRKPTWLRLADQHPICTLPTQHSSEISSNN